MSNFTPAEIEYLKSRRLGRLATIGLSGQLHVVPVRFKFNEALDAIDLGGKGMGTSKKFRDATHNSQAAFVVDDTEQGPRGLEIRGTAEVHTEGGDTIWADADPQFVRLWPAYIVSWGVDTSPIAPNGRAVPSAPHG